MKSEQIAGKGITVEGLDQGYWQAEWPGSPTARTFLQGVPFRPAKRFATLGVEAAPAALVAAALWAEEVTAYGLTAEAEQRLRASAGRNGITNLRTSQELPAAADRFEMIVACGTLTHVECLAPGGRLYTLTPVGRPPSIAGCDVLLLTHAGWREVIVERPAARRAIFTAQHPRAGMTNDEVEWLIGWERLAASPDADLVLLNAHPRARYVDAADRRLRHFLLQCDGVKSTYEHFHDLKRSAMIGADAAESEFALWMKDLIAEGYLEIAAYPMPSNAAVA